MGGLDEARERIARRLAAGTSREQLIAELLDGKSLDAMKAATALGICARSSSSTLTAM